MIKISKNNIEIGTTFQIRNTWRKQIAKELEINEEDFPFVFKIVDSETNMKETLFFAESVKNEKEEKIVKLKISEIAIKYLIGEEVEDCNVGLYFKDYLPLENTKLLISDNKNTLLVHPVVFKLNVFVDKVNKKKTPVINLVLTNILTGENSNIVSQCQNSWKFLKGVDAYMNDIEKMYQDTFIHKEFVMMACEKFAKYLINEGDTALANELMERAIVHDNSKIINKDEFRSLTSIINDKSCLKNASSKLSQFKQDSIELHWKHNAHHPEHFENINEMTKLDKIEMCCDWYARAMQYKTNLLEFVEERQANRFCFPELMYEEILHYCKILLES